MATLQIEIEDKIYRATVVPWIFNCARHAGKIVVGRSIREHVHNKWQPAQGGLEEEEADNPLIAVFREAWEEFGIPQDRLALVAGTLCFPKFDFPATRKPHPTYAGEILGSFALVARPGIKIMPGAHRHGVEEIEFDRARWVELEQLQDICPKYKIEAYKTIIEALTPFRNALRIIGPQTRQNFINVPQRILDRDVLQAAITDGKLTQNFPRFPPRWINGPGA